MTKNVLIGRDEEKSALEKSLESAFTGHGSSIIINGQPGIGKTTLVDCFCEAAWKKGAVIFRGASSPDQGQPFLAFSSALKDLISKPLFESQEHVSFSQILAISPAGMLIAKATSKDEEVDADIFAGMLTAVQSFVRDSFDSSGSGTAGLGRLEYGNMKIMIEHGKHMFLVAVLKEQEHPEMARSLKSYLRELEDNHGHLLDKWTGSMTLVKPIEESLINKIGIKFLVKKELEGVKVEAERFRIANNILETLENVSVVNPVLLVLEDIHWADDSTGFVIRFLARNIRQDQIMLLGTARPDEADSRSLILQQLREDATAEEMNLQGLDIQAVNGIIQSRYSPNDFPAAFAERLHRECGGNPFFVSELLRQMADEGIITLSDGAFTLTRQDFPIPSSIEEIILKRLDTLEPESLVMAEYLSCAGRETDIRIAGSIPNITNPSEALGKLCSQGIVILAEEKAQFTHALFHSTIYTGISSRWKSTHHKALGEYFENAFSENLDDCAYELARHYSNSNAYEKAAGYCVKAGEKAERAYAIEQAMTFYNDSLSALSKSRRSPESQNLGVMLYERIADASVMLGRFGPALENYEKALEKASDSEIVARLHRKSASNMIATSDYDGARSEAKLCMDIAGESNIEFQRGKLQLASLNIRLGDFSEAITLSGEIIQALDRDKINDIAAATRMKGIGEWYLGKYRQALETFEFGLTLLKSSTEMAGRARTLNSQGIVFIDIGDSSSAIAKCEEAIEIYKKIGDQPGLASAYGTLAVVFQRMGDFENARVYMLKGLEMFNRIGDKNGIALSHCNLSVIETDYGEFKSAEQNARKAMEVAEKAGDVHAIAFSLFMLAGITREMGDLEKSLEMNRDVLRRYEEIGTQQRILGTKLAIASILTEMGKPEEALPMFRECLTKGQEMTDIEGILESKIEMANCLGLMNQFDEAIKICAEAIEESKAGNAKSYTAIGYQIMGKLASASGTEDPMPYFTRAEKEYTEQNSRPGIAKTGYEIGVHLSRTGRKDEAIKILTTVFTESEDMGMRLLAAKCRKIVDED